MGFYSVDQESILKIVKFIKLLVLSVVNILCIEEGFTVYWFVLNWRSWDNYTG